MITRAQITRRAARDNVPAITVERDYVLAHVIAGVATLEIDSGLVFKGGTALRLCYIDDYRYSADLDFSLASGSIENAYEAITLALASTSGSIPSQRGTVNALINIESDGKMSYANTYRGKFHTLVR